jgi:hypothetical protein
MVISEEQVAMLAQMAGIAIDPAYRASVAVNLTLLLDRAALIMAPPLDAAIEPAPAFRA